MDRRLNHDAITQALQHKGLTQTQVAERLGITRAAVSKWMRGLAFPRPPELLKLGKLLGIGYGDLVRAPAPTLAEPIIAFRKRAATKTTLQHRERAKDMGRLLRPVVRHLPFNEFISPSRLSEPSLEYGYLQGVVRKLREELKISPSGPIGFEQLIGKFGELQAVIVPVMWGQKDRHENALHVYLPDSKTTWIYLNLDSHLYDFKFWMAHELGHVLAVDLLTSGDEDLAEDFSDAFAGALLFPEPSVGPVYPKYVAATTVQQRISLLLEVAEAYVISPNTVYRQLESYHKAKEANVEFPALTPKTLFSAISLFKRRSRCVSEQLFKEGKPSAAEFLKVCSGVFKTPAFAALAGYMKEVPVNDSTLSQMLDIPLVDARELRASFTVKA